MSFMFLSQHRDTCEFLWMRYLLIGELNEQHWSIQKSSRQMINETWKHQEVIMWKNRGLCRQFWTMWKKFIGSKCTLPKIEKTRFWCFEQKPFVSVNEYEEVLSKQKLCHIFRNLFSTFRYHSTNPWRLNTQYTVTGELCRQIMKFLLKCWKTSLP